MRHFSKMAAVVCSLISTGTPAESSRHADAHVHGAGHLNFAIEGHRVHLELEVPGFDILGFESMTSEPHRKQLKDALKALEKKDLWFFTPAAGCRLKTASAAVSGEDEGEDDGEDEGECHHDHHKSHHHNNKEHHKEHHKEHGHDEQHAVGHMDIAATYVYVCAKIAKLNSISTRLFERFANSNKLKVQGFTGSGQIAGQMSRQRPEVRF